MIPDFYPLLSPLNSYEASRLVPHRIDAPGILATDKRTCLFAGLPVCFLLLMVGFRRKKSGNSEAVYFRKNNVNVIL